MFCARTEQEPYKRVFLDASASSRGSY